MNEKDLKNIPFTEKDLTFWRQEIKAARQKRDQVASDDGWDDNLTRYKPAHKDRDGKINSDVNTGADFRDVERKKAALLFEFPQIGLSVKEDQEIEPASEMVPKALMLSTLVGWHSKILNTTLGPGHADAEHAARKVLFACLCPSGVGPAAVGYQCTFKKVKKLTPVLNPLTGLPVMKPIPALEQVGAALGMIQPMPEPLLQEVEVEIPIHERWFVSDYSPKALLIPASFKDTNYRRAPWLGRDIRKPRSQWIREYGLPANWTGGKTDEQEKTHFEHGEAETHEDDAGDPYLTGVELYYRTQIRSTAEVHPEALRKLVLADGADTPVVHVDSPHQDFDPETGMMSPTSLKDFVDRPLVLRDLTDSAWVPSDSAVTAQLTKEGEKYRTQIITNRDGMKQVIAFDADKLDPTAKDKIVNANGVIWVPVQGGALAAGKDALMVQVTNPTLGRETYEGMRVIEHDRELVLGISANQSGVQNASRKTATEVENVQRNSEARFEQERKRVNAWVVEIASAIDTLILRYMGERVAVQILGEVRGKLWAKYKSRLYGCYNYDLKIDSGKYMDFEADRHQTLNEYNLLRKDPLINPQVLLKKVAEKLGHDPAEFILEPQKPDKDLKAAVSLKGEDLNPLNPAFAINVALLRQGGWQISEQDVQLAQQQAQGQSGGMMPVSGVGPTPGKQPVITSDHPGAQEKMDTLNQHQADQSGERSGPKVSVN